MSWRVSRTGHPLVPPPRHSHAWPSVFRSDHSAVSFHHIRTFGALPQQRGQRLLDAGQVPPLPTQARHGHSHHRTPLSSRVCLRGLQTKFFLSMVC